MELSYKLQTLLPLKGALDILRMLGAAPPYMADSYDIMQQLDLSDRSFSKAIRRLATAGYVQMDGDQVYRLTEKGKEASEEIAEYDAVAPPQSAASEKPVDTVKRRVLLAIPPTLTAGKLTNVVVAFSPISNGQHMADSADMVVRLSVVNGEPSNSEDLIFSVTNGSVQETAQVVAGFFTQVRLKLQVFQLGPNPDDINIAGGMYVDINVVPEDGQSTPSMIAYGVDVDVLQF